VLHRPFELAGETGKVDFQFPVMRLPETYGHLVMVINGTGSGTSTFNAAGTLRSGMGGAANNRWHGFASQRAQRADRETRALSVAIPVSAYICR